MFLKLHSYFPGAESSKGWGTAQASDWLCVWWGSGREGRVKPSGACCVSLTWTSADFRASQSEPPRECQGWRGVPFGPHPATRADPLVGEYRSQCRVPQRSWLQQECLGWLGQGAMLCGPWVTPEFLEHSMSVLLAFQNSLLKI